MMTHNDFLKIEKQFHAYTRPFVDRAKDPYPFVLKQAHTARVCRAMAMLCESLGLDASRTARACAAAMVHDMGRFPQFAVFHTYSDARSKNHAALGCREIVRSNILSHLSLTDRQLILRAVALHNRPRLSRGLGAQLDRIARLLRDADKIDIYRVMKAHYRSAANGSQTFLTHNLPDDGRVSGELVDRLASGREIPYSSVSSLNDMKLFQISMIQDLNFPAAVRAVLDMGVVEVILDSMPGFSGFKSLEQRLNVYLEKAASNS